MSDYVPTNVPDNIEGLPLAYTPEELQLIAGVYVYLAGVPQQLRDDAEQEFAIAGWKAASAAEHGENIQAFQVKAGRWAVKDFIKQENRRRLRQERYMLATFGTMDSGLSEESMPDQNAINPEDETILHEDGDRSMALLQALPEPGRSIVKGVVLDGRTQRELAAEFQLARSTVSDMLRRILHKFSKKIR